MQVIKNISPPTARRALKDFVPLVFAFFASLVVLSLYQNVQLYYDGVLNGFINKSLLLLLLHHTGYTALIALFLVFLYNFLENKKPNKGLQLVRKIFMVLIVVEGLLISFYVQNHEILSAGIVSMSDAENIRFNIITISVILVIALLVFHYSHKATAFLYTVISKMYPFTIVLFGLFLATLNSTKKPINENKTQHLISSMVIDIFDFNTYKGSDEFPLLKPYKPNHALEAYFELTDKKPNLVFLIIEGLGADYIGENARFKEFAPCLNSIKDKSLFWENHVSNTGVGFAALPTIMGSLPFGDAGFTNNDQFTNRHTLYSILKENGYSTSFNYGGNSALNHYDKFLNEEGVDIVLDKNSFGEGFSLQTEDASGVSLGYPDKELFKKWNSQPNFNNGPSLAVFQTLSTKNPFLIPNREKYIDKVSEILSKPIVKEQSRKLVKRNKEIFASVLYSDEAIESFLKTYRKREDYSNTIFIITGSHNLTDIPHNDELGRYRVPLMVYSPLLKSPQHIKSLASHADIAPSLISLLDNKYKLTVPEQVAWLGNSLVSKDVFVETKQIPLFRRSNTIKDYIVGNHYLSGRALYKLNETLKLTDTDDKVSKQQLKAHLRYFKSVNTYVTQNDKIIPEAQSLIAQAKNDFTKKDIVWVESVFNGTNVDNAYKTARKLAFDKEWERSLLLCNYILSQTPRHVDTEILIGRINSWQKNYTKSIKVLEEVVHKYPKYEDGYAALLDAYYWAGINEKAILLNKSIVHNGIRSLELVIKMDRAKINTSKQTVKIKTNSQHIASGDN